MGLKTTPLYLCRQVAGGAHPPRLLRGEPGGHVPAVVQRQVPVDPAPSGEPTSQVSHSCGSFLPCCPAGTAKRSSGTYDFMKVATLKSDLVIYAAGDHEAHAPLLHALLRAPLARHHRECAPPCLLAQAALSCLASSSKVSECISHQVELHVRHSCAGGPSCRDS